MNIAPFGDLDPEALNEYYSGELNIGDNCVDIDLFFEESTIEPTELEFIEQALFDLDSKVEAAFDAIADDFELDEESETARFYLNHHFEQFSEQQFYELFGTNELEDVDVRGFLGALKLVRISLYPEDEEAFMVFDIQLPTAYTSYLMAVTFNREGYLAAVGMDS